MANRPDPYIRKDPGDLIRSGDWNDAQVRAREEIRSHRHNSVDGSLPIPRAGIEEKAIDGSRIDPAAVVTARNLSLSGDLKVDGRFALANLGDLAVHLSSLDRNKLDRAGDEVSGSLRIRQRFSATGDLDSQTSNAQPSLHIIHPPQDAQGNALVVGQTSGSESHLRLGYHSDYSWIQSHGGKPLTINPLDGNVGIGTLTPQTKLEVAGVVRAHTLEATNPLRHRMYPGDPLVYQDIFDARDQGVISKLGSPTYFNDTEYRTKQWLQRPLIAFGANGEVDGNGAQVVVPGGYDTVWIRVLGDRWTVVKAYFLNGNREGLGCWAGGFRAANCYCPDGSLSDGSFCTRDNKDRIAHQWLPIPVRRSGLLALVSAPNTTDNFWLSGVAFGRNPWSHAAQSAVAYHWALNGGEHIGWNSHEWNQDVLAEIPAGSYLELKVPVIPSGRDKLLYLVEHNNSGSSLMNAGITINHQPVERFISSYDNPFARHWNSKYFNRYVAARIPRELVADNTCWLSVRIDMRTQSGRPLYCREIGTHDLDTPWG
jgi:hypothetical protein